MSLTVPAKLLEQAKTGDISDADFIDCIRTSLPYAWTVVSRLADQMAATGTDHGEDGTPPPSDEEHAQLLRLVGSDAMRAAVEQRFGYRLAFQNCCKIGLFAPSASEAHAKFVSPRAQVLNQKPALINC